MNISYVLHETFWSFIGNEQTVDFYANSYFENLIRN